MAEKEIKITFPEERMEALVFFLGEQNEQVENVLKTHLDKTYEKIVPAQVRKFVESRMTSQEETDQEQESQNAGRRQGSGQRQARVQGRRNSRQQEPGGVQENRQQEPAGEEEQSEDSGIEQEETHGMSMNM